MVHDGTRADAIILEKKFSLTCISIFTSNVELLATNKSYPFYTSPDRWIWQGNSSVGVGVGVGFPLDMLFPEWGRTTKDDPFPFIGPQLRHLRLEVSCFHVSG